MTLGAGRPPSARHCWLGDTKQRDVLQHNTTRLNWPFWRDFPPPPSEHSIFLKPSLPLNPVSRFVIVSPPLNYVGGEIFRGDVGESMFSNIWGGKIFSHLMGGEIFIFFDNNIHFLPVYHWYYTKCLVYWYIIPFSHSCSLNIYIGNLAKLKYFCVGILDQIKKLRMIVAKIDCGWRNIKNCLWAES